MPETTDLASLRAASGGSSRSYVAFDTTQVTSKANRSNPQPGDPCHPLAAGAHAPAIAGSAVRRLTPRECERLQGFPDDYTLIPVKVKRAEPKGSGPCAKQTVIATVVDVNGIHYTATNYCMAPQLTCARGGLPTGQGYELCSSICKQPAHAEINALRLAGEKARGGVLYLQGHTYACEPCTQAAYAAGVIEIRLGRPPGNAADGPRYKALGNSMAVPVMRWIGERIEMVEQCAGACRG